MDNFKREFELAQQLKWNLNFHSNNTYWLNSRTILQGCEFYFERKNKDTIEQIWRHSGMPNWCYLSYRANNGREIFRNFSEDLFNLLLMEG